MTQSVHKIIYQFRKNLEHLLKEKFAFRVFSWCSVACFTLFHILHFKKKKEKRNQIFLKKCQKFKKYTWNPECRTQFVSSGCLKVFCSSSSYRCVMKFIKKTIGSPSWSNSGQIKKSLWFAVPRYHYYQTSFEAERI